MVIHDALHVVAVALLSYAGLLCGADAESDDRFPRRAPGDSPALTANVAAMRTGQQAERVLDLAAPKAWNRADYLADRAAYCAEVIPGRFHQVKQGGPGVETIEVVGAATIAVTKGEQVTLVLQGAPDSPITLVSDGGGSFANLLTCITVASDAQGRAAVPWTATGGTIGDVRIAASCPENAGHAYFYLNVQ